jgi:REP-associated tyrosine transposase
MPRRLRSAPGGYVYHVLNRAVGRRTLFKKDGDYAAFEAALEEAADFQPMRLLAYCLMPNHWHLVLWPKADGDLSRYVRWLTVTHAQRYHAHYHTAGTGPLYQGRFKSFPVQAGDHLRTVCRYAERNALRAGLVRRAERWRWSSLWHEVHGHPDWLTAWPGGGRPALAAWLESVNRPETVAELAAVRRSVARGAPYGEPAWTERTAGRLGLESTLRPRGRPPKARPEEAE